MIDEHELKAMRASMSTEERAFFETSQHRVRQVLDHGFVMLRDSMPNPWLSRGTTPIGLGVGDMRVVEAARVSTDHLPDEVLDILGIPHEPEERTPEQNMGLLNYMFKNRHTTPFEQVRFTFIIKLPIFVARQKIRHRMGSFNEESARYSQLANEFYVPTVERMQRQSTSNKQGSAEALPLALAEEMRQRQIMHSEASYCEYEWLLEQGLTRELARNVLTLNFYTKWYWTVDLHNLLGLLRQRLDGHAQWEFRAYARAIGKLAQPVAPYTFSLFLSSLDRGSQEMFDGE